MCTAIGNMPGSAVQSLDARRGAVDDASEFGAEFGLAVFEQALLRFFDGEPGGVSIRFLRRLEPRHFAEMCGDGKLGLGEARIRGPLVFFRCCRIRLAAEVAREGEFFHPAMNSRLFESLEGSGLGVGEAGLNAAFGENPASAASLHQEEFDAASADTVTNGGDLLASFGKP